MTEGDVLENFNQRAAQTGQNAVAERRVNGSADDHFQIAADLLLHLNAAQAGESGRPFCQQRIQRRGVLNAEPDAADIGFVDVFRMVLRRVTCLDARLRSRHSASR